MDHLQKIVNKKDIGTEGGQTRSKFHLLVWFDVLCYDTTT
jgi:hypothetical protein